MLVRYLELLGTWVISRFELIGDVVMVTLETFRQVRHNFRMKHMLTQMSHLGVDTLPIVLLTMTFTGIVLTMQMAGKFAEFGAQSTIGGVITIAIGRELGPVLVGVVCAGRVGAAITAEISTMKVTEQIDALRVMAVNPVGYLVVPRMVACMMMVPMLTVFGDVIGVLGGWAVAVNYSGMSTFLYFNSIDTFVVASDIFGGIVKAVVFGAIVAIIGCYNGLRSPAGAEGVGKATTQTVVGAIVLIFMSNVFLSFIIY